MITLLFIMILLFGCVKQDKGIGAFCRPNRSRITAADR